MGKLPSKIQDGRAQFGLAFDLLEEIDLTKLRDLRNTLANRVRVALDEVWHCSADHFARKRDYEAFAAIKAEIDARGSRRVVVPAMSVDDLHTIANRLLAIAREVEQDRPS